VAYVLAGGGPEESLAVRLRRAVMLNVAAVYPVIVSLVFYVGLVPLGQQVNLAGDSRPWLTVLAAIGDGWTFAWYATLLLLVPWLTLGGREARTVVLLSLACVALCFNPIAGPLLSRILSAVYFRLFYMFPLPLCAGLAVAALVREWTWPPKARSVFVAGALRTQRRGRRSEGRRRVGAQRAGLEPLEPAHAAIGPKGSARERWLREA
jgi:hypothetical protein